jgi:glycogen synthase
VTTTLTQGANVMNILMFSHLYYPYIGGVEIAVENLSKQFINNGHKVEIVTSRFPRNIPKSEFVSGIKVTRLPFRLPSSNVFSILKFFIRVFECTFFLLCLVKKSRFDIINLHYVGENALYALIISYLKRIPLITNIHGSDIEYFALKGKLHKLIVQATLNRSLKIISNSNALLKVTSKMFGDNIYLKSVVIGNGVNLSNADQPVNNFLNVAPYLLGIGRLEHFKGFDILIKSFGIVNQKHPDMKLILVGDGSERGKLTTISQQLGLEDSVLFYGRMDQKDVLKILSGCKFTVQPSRREGFGMVLIEAMALGKAVIATNVGGIPELVQHGKNGLLVNSQDPDDLARAIIGLLNSPELALKLGAKGKEMVESNYTWEIISNRFLGVFQSVLKCRLGV